MEINDEADARFVAYETIKEWKRRLSKPLPLGLVDDIEFTAQEKVLANILADALFESALDRSDLYLDQLMNAEYRIGILTNEIDALREAEEANKKTMQEFQRV